MTVIWKVFTDTSGDCNVTSFTYTSGDCCVASLVNNSHDCLKKRCSIS